MYLSSTIISELIKKYHTKRIDFNDTRQAPRYKDFQKDPNHKDYNKFTYERFWNQNGYSKIIYDSITELPEKIIENSTLIDLGSGKGHAVFAFGIDWKFKKILGVEITKDYVDISKNNLNTIQEYMKNSPFRFNVILPEIEFICSNILDFEFTEDIQVAFMFNPFGPKTTTKVVEKIIKSLDKFPRDFYILYRDANFRDLFLDTGRFKVIYHTDGPSSGKPRKYFILKGR